VTRALPIGWYFPFRVAQLRDARARGGKLRKWNFVHPRARAKWATLFIVVRSGLKGQHGAGGNKDETSMILVRIARIIHPIICVAAFMVFVNHGSAQESEPSETVQTETKHDNVPPAGLSRSTGSDCAAPVEGSQAIVFAPLQTSEFARGRHAKRQDRAREGRSAISTDPTPTLQRDTAFCTLKAAERYRRIADNGGWVRIPKALRQGAFGRC
jgi:hypothetical protein